MSMTEREFQQAVVQLARLMGWRVHHTRPALTQRGRWLDALASCAGVECYLWTPNDWDAIVRMLTGGK